MMMNPFKKELIEKITTAARNAFIKITKEKSTENFFAFSLLTFDDVLSCYAYANSKESYFRTIKDVVPPNLSEQAYYKWTPQEWEYNCIEREEFNDVYDFSEKLLKDIKEDAFYPYK